MLVHGERMRKRRPGKMVAVWSERHHACAARSMRSSQRQRDIYRLAETEWRRAGEQLVQQRAAFLLSRASDAATARADALGL